MVTLTECTRALIALTPLVGGAFGPMRQHSKIVRYRGTGVPSQDGKVGMVTVGDFYCRMHSSIEGIKTPTTKGGKP
jgi:hypothetical protein